MIFTFHREYDTIISYSNRGVKNGFCFRKCSLSSVSSNRNN